MKPLKPVTGAMSPKGKSGSVLPKVCLTVMGMLMIVFFLSLGGSNKSESDNLRSGQAHNTGKANVQTVPQTTPSTSNTGGGSTTSSTSGYSSGSTTEGGTPSGGEGEGGGGEWYEDSPNAEDEAAINQEDLEETVEVANDDIRNAETNEVKKEDGMLSQAVHGMGSAISSGIKALLGTGASDEEVEEITKEVETQLLNETSHDFHKKADEITNNEVNLLNSVVREDEEEGLDPVDTEADVMDYEKEAIDNVRTGVDKAAEDMKQRMRERAAMMEKAIMEKRLSDRLGRPVQLQIVEGNVQRMPEQIPSGDPRQGFPPPAGQGYTQQQQGYYQQPPPPQGGYQQGGYQPQYQQGGYQQPPPPPQGGYQQPPPQQGYNGYQQPPPQQGGYNPTNGYGGAAGAPGSTYGAPAGGSTGYGSGSTTGTTGYGSTTGTTGNTGYGSTTAGEATTDEGNDDGGQGNDDDGTETTDGGVNGAAQDDDTGDDDGA